jgi:hypothetical protein
MDGDRRAFFQGVARYAAAAGLSVLAGSLVLRPQRRLAGQKCIAEGICRSCAQVSGCKLPAALSFRQARKAGDGAGA